jgi:hypothetical protein
MPKTPHTDEVVKALEKMLFYARQGKFTSMLCIAAAPLEEIHHFAVASEKDLARLAGLCVFLQHDIIEMRKSCEEENKKPS